MARGSIRSPRASQPEPPRHLVRSELQRPVGAARETGCACGHAPNQGEYSRGSLGRSGPSPLEDPCGSRSLSCGGFSHA